jgi:hypothetical protein
MDGGSSGDCANPTGVEPWRRVALNDIRWFMGKVCRHEPSSICDVRKTLTRGRRAEEKGARKGRILSSPSREKGARKADYSSPSRPCRQQSKEN